MYGKDTAAGQVIAAALRNERPRRMSVERSMWDTKSGSGNISPNKANGRDSGSPVDSLIAAERRKALNGGLRNGGAVGGDDAGQQDKVQSGELTLILAAPSDEELRAMEEAGLGFVPQAVDHSEVKQNLTNDDFDQVMADTKQRLAAPDAPSVFPLPRGGTYAKTSIGGIQFGMPPETVKDGMVLGLKAASYLVVPKERFNRAYGVNVAECEFPAYFNFFVLQGKATLVCDPEDEQLIRAVFQETVFGPSVANELLSQEWCGDVGAKPDLQAELDHWRENPRKKGTMMEVDSLLTFVHFDSSGMATVKDGDGNTVTIERSITEYVIVDNGKVLGTAPLGVDLPTNVHPALSSHEMLAMASRQFEIPSFGITFLGTSHGFDPMGTTVGFVLWMNGRGIMVDPPPNSQAILQREGIQARLIDTVILTHCHADHDAGTFQKLLDESKIKVITTPTIMGSFLRKYSALSGFSQSVLLRLFTWVPVDIGEPIKYHGGELEFCYTFHSIPTIGFRVRFGGKLITYSGDTCYDPTLYDQMVAKGVMTRARADYLLSYAVDPEATLIIHEAGGPPLHTRTDVMAELPEDIKRKLYSVHAATKGFPFERGLKLAACGVQHTIRVPVKSCLHNKEIELLDLVGGVKEFRAFTLAKAREVLQLYRRVSYSAGDHIFRSGDPGDTFFIIERGICEVYDEGFSKLFTVGDYLGEMSVLKSEKRTANLRAVTDCIMIAFGRYDFLGLIRNTEAQESLETVAAMRNDESWDVLNANGVFRECTEGQKTQLMSIMGRRTLRAGERLWRAGDTVHQMALIKSGRLRIEGQVAEAAFGKGCLLDRADLVLEGRAKHAVTVVAQEFSEIYTLDREDLCEFFELNPGVLVKLYGSVFCE